MERRRVIEFSVDSHAIIITTVSSGDIWILDGALLLLRARPNLPLSTSHDAADPAVVDTDGRPNLPTYSALSALFAAPAGLPLDAPLSGRRELGSMGMEQRDEGCSAAMAFGCQRTASQGDVTCAEGLVQVPFL